MNRELFDDAIPRLSTRHTAAYHPLVEIPSDVTPTPVCVVLCLSACQVQLTTLNGAEILSLGQWEACEALREAFSAAESWSRDSAREGRRGFPNAIGRRCAVIFLDEADALLAR